MEKALLILGGVLLFAVLLFAAAIILPICGALAGWIAGLFFPKTLTILADALGLTGFPPWQLGAALGFVASFFKTYSSSK